MPSPTLSSYQDRVTSTSGGAVPGAIIAVLEGQVDTVDVATQPGSPLANIYADAYGYSQIPQAPISISGTVTTVAGSPNVTYASGNQLSAFLINLIITINGVQYTVLSVDSIAGTLVLATNALSSGTFTWSATIPASQISAVPGFGITDGDGNFQFWTVAGYYVLQIYAPQMPEQFIQGVSIGGEGGGSGGVTSLNSLVGTVDIVAGSGIAVTESGNDIIVTNTGGGGGGGVTSLNGGTGALAVTAGAGISVGFTGSDIVVTNSSSPASLPWFDVQAYGGQPRLFSTSAETTTATSVGGTPNLTLASALHFITGQWAVLWKAGNATTQSTPAAPSVVANCVQGSGTLNYQCVGVDNLGGLTAASPLATITNAPNIFGNLRVAISSITATGGTVTVNFATPINAVSGQTIHIIKVTGAGTTWNGVWTVVTAPTTSSVTYSVSGATGTGTVSASSTGRLSNVQPITAISRSAVGVITITTAEPHNYVASPASKNPAIVIVENCSPPDLNGQYVIATASGSTITCDTGQWIATSGTVTPGSSIATCYEYTYITCPAYSGTTVAYYIYSDSPNPGSPLQLIGKTMPGEMGWKDGGPTLMQGFTAPGYVPTIPPIAAQNQMFGAQIISGGGTTSLVLSANVPNTVTSQRLMHDDGQAIAAAFTASHLTSDQSAAVFMSPPQGAAPFLPQYIINYPVTVPLNDSLIWGSQPVLNETVSMAGGNAMWMSPLGYMGSIDIQFGVGPYMPLTGIASPQVYVSGDSTTFQNIAFLPGGGATGNPNQQNGQYGLIIQAGKSKLRDCFFGSGNSSTAIPCILNSPTGGTVNIAFDNCQWSGSSTFGNVSTVVGQSALLPGWCCNLWIHGSDNAGGVGATSQISIGGNCSFQGRGILIDANNYSNSSEQNYLFGVGGTIEYQAPCTPSVMLWGQFFINVVMANWLNDTEQGNIAANWTNTLVSNIRIENCNTSGNANLATGNAFQQIRFKGCLAPTATSDFVLGQNINRVADTVGAVVVTTGSTSDVLTIGGLFQGSILQVSAGNASAATDLGTPGTVYFSALGAHTVTLNHSATPGSIFYVSGTGGF